MEEHATYGKYFNVFQQSFSNLFQNSELGELCLIMVYSKLLVHLKVNKKQEYKVK